MLCYYNCKLDRWQYCMHSGEYIVSADKLVSTILGSCVSVCLRDRESGLVGVNHFVSPYGDAVKYGEGAMRVLLGELGNNVEAKVFGGASLYEVGRDVAVSNIDFAMRYLWERGIPVLSRDLGGRYGRRIMVFSEDFKIHRIFIKGEGVLI